MEREESRKEGLQYLKVGRRETRRMLLRERLCGEIGHLCEAADALSTLVAKSVAITWPEEVSLTWLAVATLALNLSTWPIAFA